MLIPGPGDPVAWTTLAKEVAAGLDPNEAGLVAKELGRRLEDEAFASSPSAWRLYGYLSFETDRDAFVRAYRRVAELSQSPDDWITAGHVAFQSILRKPGPRTLKQPGWPLASSPRG